VSAARELDARVSEPSLILALPEAARELHQQAFRHILDRPEAVQIAVPVILAHAKTGG